MNQFCTIVSKEYLERVWVLDESRRTWCGEFPLHVLSLDEYSSDRFRFLEANGYTTGIELWNWDLVATEELGRARLTRSWHEWVWTIKPYWILHLMRTLKQWDGLTYVDGDMCFFNHPASVFEELENFDLGITPHRFSRGFTHYSVNGDFNGAFVHVKNTENALGCIAHWTGQCLRRCSLQHAQGSFVDQKYLDTWPGRWGARSLRHKGVNLAPWNQGENHYHYDQFEGRMTVDNQPVVLYHFHEGLKTAYPLDPFVQEQIYRPYETALKRARRTIELCAS